MILSLQNESICVLHRPNAAHVIGFDMLIRNVYVQAMFKAKGKSRVFKSNPSVMEA